MDPLIGQWTYQHADRGLHPTAAGDAWIAGKVEAILRAHGIVGRPAATARPHSGTPSATSASRRAAGQRHPRLGA